MNNSNTSRYLLNPFEYVAGTKALGIGAVFFVLSILTGSLFNARFDGVLNLHFVKEVEFTSVLYDQLINFLSLAVIFFLVALVSGASKTRFIDIAGTTLLAMAPIALLPILNINNYLHDSTVQLVENLNPDAIDGAAMTWIVTTTLLMLLALVWHVSLLYKAYKISTNLKGSKLVAGFIIGLLLAMIASKYLITIIP